MSSRKLISSIDEQIEEILGAAGREARRHGNAQTRIRRDFETIAQRDYERQLQRHFSRRELGAVFAAIGKCVTGLNRQQFKVAPLADLDRLAGRFGAELKARPFTGTEGLSLRGFYAKNQLRGRRPLICVNTAHHPAAIGTAFWHELGHHLSARMLGARRGPVTLSFSADYAQHLDDPIEIIADLLVCLPGYPKPVARRLFAGPLKGSTSNGGPLIDGILAKTRVHLRKVAGFEFEPQTPATENLHYLAGMIHYVKLRFALMAQYDI